LHYEEQKGFSLIELPDRTVAIIRSAAIAIPNLIGHRIGRE